MAGESLKSVEPTEKVNFKYVKKKHILTQRRNHHHILRDFSLINQKKEQFINKLSKWQNRKCNFLLTYLLKNNAFKELKYETTDKTKINF